MKRQTPRDQEPPDEDSVDVKGLSNTVWVWIILTMVAVPSIATLLYVHCLDKLL